MAGLRESLSTKSRRKWPTQCSNNGSQKVAIKHPLKKWVRRVGLQTLSQRQDPVYTWNSLIQIIGVKAQAIQNTTYYVYSFLYIPGVGFSEPWIIFLIIILKTETICINIRIFLHIGLWVKGKIWLCFLRIVVMIETKIWF